MRRRKKETDEREKEEGKRKRKEKKARKNETRRELRDHRGVKRLDEMRMGETS